MGIRQSLDITVPEKEHGEKKVQNGAPNGHALSGPDLPDAVSLEVSVQQNSEPPAKIQTDIALPTPEPVPAAVISVEVSPDPAVPAETIILTNTETPKLAQTGNFFKMFKKKNEPVIPEPEVTLDVSVQQNSELPALILTDNALPTPEPVPAAVVSVEVSPDPAVPAETITLTNTETPKPVQTANFFKMFKKKNDPVIPEPEVSLDVPVQQNSEPPAMILTDNALPTPEPVPAAVVSVEVSPDLAVPAEMITITNTEPPKPVQKPSLFNRFKKKNEPAIPEPEVSLDVSVQQNSEPPSIILTDKALPTPEPVPAAVVSVEVSPVPAVPAETITITNTGTPKPAQKPSLFNRFKKKNEPVIPEPEVSLDVSVQQNSDLPTMIETDNALPAPEPVPAAVVSVEVSPDPAVPAETITLTNIEPPKLAQKPSLFNRFKKKNEPVIPEPEVSLDVSVQQNSEPPAMILTDNALPTPEPVPAAVVSVEVSPDLAVPAEMITITNTEPPKPVQKPSLFNRFKKKNEPAIPEPEVSLDVSVQQNSEPPSIILTDKALPTPEPVPAAVVSVEVSPVPAVPAETITITNTETPKPAQKPSLFNRFKKKNESVIPEPEVSLEVSVQQNSDLPTMIETDNALPTPEPVPAAVVSVEVSPVPAVPAETITLTNIEPIKPVQKPSLFNRFKKKNEPAIPEPEVSLDVSVQQNSEAPSIILTDKALPTPEPVPAAVVSVEVSPVPAVPAETITITNTETPKPAQKPSLFNRFKKNEPVIPEPEVSLDVSVQQNSELPAMILTDNALPTPEPVPAAVVSVEVSPEIAVPAEMITITNTEPPKPVQKPSLFNRFKKKNEPVIPEPEVTLEVSLQQNSELPIMIETDKALPTPEPVPAAVVSVEVSPDPAVPAETITLTNIEPPKPAQKPSLFNRFKKKNEAVIPEPEASLDVSVQQNSEPPTMIETDNALPTPEPVPAAVVSVEVSPDKAIPTETITITNTETPKPVQKPSLFNRFKKKNEPVIPEPEVTLEVSVQQNSEAPAVTQTDNTLPAPEPVPAAVVSVEVSPDPVISITPANKEPPKLVKKPSLFNRLKKKNEPVIPEPEVSLEVSVQQNSEAPAVTQTDNALPAPEPVPAAVVSVEVSPDPVISITSANKEPPKPVQKPSLFNKFKKKNEPVIPEPEVTLEVSVQQNSEASAVTLTDNPLPTPEPVPAAVVSVEVSPDKAIPTETITLTNTETPKPAQTGNFFKMFKKKNEPVIPEPEANVAEVPEELIVPEMQTDGQKSEPPDIKGSTQAEKVPQGESLSPSAAEVDEDSSSQPEESEAEENPVMNFFKTLVSPTKATKEAAAAPDASKDQSQKETPSAPTPNVPEPMKVPPPPPPAPPKMESKAEPAIKKEEPPAAEAAAAAAGKETPSRAKAKAKDSPFGKLFRPKALLGKVVSKVQAATASGASAPSKTSAPSEVKEEAQPVEVQVDASKTSTLEAAAKPEPPPAPKPEEKKSEKKPSPFANLLKPKVLLGQVSSKIRAAASSAAASVSLATGGAAAEPKKEAPAAAAPAVPDPAASAKAKEEPKPAATAAATAAVTAAAPDNKSVGSADNPSPSIPRKLEKRNSIQLFFKNLGQKRHSDAGVQTEAVAPEKAK
ncbi:breast carcinoma-amplified sequence 1 isoform X7 [Astyanax mexicanus]|uniref:breast carcinoma-amplified sequence 1 isoform X7 n=1 Tax=Astyanax mexicanus TaxID=7994 RepID=UPI0020CB288C|nr:breast carcinoma-amplified sequence 1 isoform X7 [Astyanax mexicanus]